MNHARTVDVGGEIPYTIAIGPGLLGDGDALAADLMSEAARLGMDALVEVHDEDEMVRAGKLGAKSIDEYLSAK